MPEPLPGEPLNLPATTLGGEVEADVYDGEIVDEPPAQRPVYVLQVVRIAQTINIVVQGTPARLAVRHGSLVAVGVVVALRRWHRHRTFHRRMADAAAAAGEHEIALKHRQHAEIERHQRHERRVALAEVIVLLFKTLPAIAAGTLGVMTAFGILLMIAERRLEAVAIPFTTAAQAAQDTAAIAPDALTALAIAVPVGGVLALHHLGRHAGDLAPAWSITADPGDEDRGLVVTADTIVLALQNVPVTPLKKAFGDGWKPAFSLQPVKDGRGYSAVFSLPLGVTPDMIADQRPVFARNLHREEIEVWPSAGPPGFASLWVADPGAISKAAPEYPLLHEGTTDVFKGVPGGVTPRGDEALIPVASNNMVVGGQMGQGKSNACRVYMLGCALDPLCQLEVFVFANNGDFDSFAPRLALYRKGVEDDTVAAAVDRLHELYDEVARREGRLAELGAKKLTRAISEQHPDMRPIVVLFSECHELFGHPELGDLAAELATKIAKRARKTGAVLVFDTQSSRKEAIPPKLVELVSVNAAFYVKTWRSNDGFLGDGSFAAGIRATELRPGRDRGTSVVTGISDAQFELLRWYYVEVDDDTGFDAAADVIARCMKTVAPGTPVAGNSPVAAIEVRDLLDDLAEVIVGPDRVRLADLPARLRKLAKSWGPYRGLSGKQLRQLLDDEGVKVTNTGNVPELDVEDLQRAIDERERVS